VTALALVTCAAGAGWERELLAAADRRDLGMRVVRRCVDHGELLGVARRDRPHAALVAAELPWVDRELVADLAAAGVRLVAVTSAPPARPLDRLGLAAVVDGATPLEDVAALLHDLVAGEGPRPSSPAAPTGTAAPVVAVWGAAGAPGRTTVAVHLASALARTGRRTVLVDADVWAPSVAQRLALAELPGLVQAARGASGGWLTPLEPCLQKVTGALEVLTGLPRAELWPEVRERAWLDVLAAVRERSDVVVVDLASPLEEDEELSFDHAPFRRNVVTRAALATATHVVLVLAADPVGVRRGVLAERDLARLDPLAPTRTSLVLNETHGRGPGERECSGVVRRWTDLDALAFLPFDERHGRALWEGRTLQEVAPRSPWLRGLAPLVGVVTS
jgi:MinD-like ATPase involved in chromosome partitioning or flagellar assembly